MAAPLITHSTGGFASLFFDTAHIVAEYPMTDDHGVLWKYIGAIRPGNTRNVYLGYLEASVLNYAGPTTGDIITLHYTSINKPRPAPPGPRAVADDPLADGATHLLGKFALEQTRTKHVLIGRAL